MSLVVPETVALRRTVQLLLPFSGQRHRLARCVFVLPALTYGSDIRRDENMPRLCRGIFRFRVLTCILATLASSSLRDSLRAAISSRSIRIELGLDGLSTASFPSSFTSRRPLRFAFPLCRGGRDHIDGEKGRRSTRTGFTVTHTK